MDPDSREHTLVYASGVAALLLLAILVWAVMRTADSSQNHNPESVPSMVRTTTSTPRTTTTSRTTSSSRVSTTETTATSEQPTESAVEMVPPEPATTSETTPTDLNSTSTTAPIAGAF